MVVGVPLPPARRTAPDVPLAGTLATALVVIALPLSGCASSPQTSSAPLPAATATRSPPARTGTARLPRVALRARVTGRLPAPVQLPAVAARGRAIPPYRYALPEGGMIATTVGPLAPTGVVQVAGQLWSARADAAPIAADQPVRVLVREGLTLVVHPLNPGAAGESEFPDVDR